MAFGLAGDCFADGGDQRLVTLALAQYRAEIGGIVLPKAHIKCPRAGEADAIAAFAEVMGEGRDEADALTGLLDPYITRRSARALTGFGQGPALLQFRPQHGDGEELIEPVLT